MERRPPGSRGNDRTARSARDSPPLPPTRISRLPSSIPSARRRRPRSPAPAARRYWRHRRRARRVKVAVPATSTSAPAAIARGAVRGRSPPSTSRSMSGPACRSSCGSLSILRSGVDEALPAEAGIDAHHQHQIDLVDQIVEHLAGRRRVERDAGLLPSALMCWSVRWRCGPASGWTVMMSAPASAKGVEVGIDRRDHQMDVERLAVCGRSAFTTRARS